MQNKELNTLIEIIKSAGEIFKEGFQVASHHKTIKSHQQDIVTIYDKKIDVFLQEKLGKLFPKLSYIGEEIYEEMGVEEKQNIDFNNAIIVDPIDGTSGFSKQIPICAISVAIVIGGVEKYGVIYNPISNQIYYAEISKGAFYNNEQINPDEFNTDIDVRMAYGAKPGSPESDIYTKVIHALIPSKEIRMLSLGSCVCECAYVVTQKLGGYLNNGTAIWDVAAAKILLKEVGIKMINLNCFPEAKIEIELNKFEFYSFICYNSKIEKTLMAKIGANKT
jgi:myo-inositol-1(or 4)-monophosphatase